MMTPDLLMDSFINTGETAAPTSPNRGRPRLLLKGDIISLDKVTLRAYVKHETEFTGTPGWSIRC